MRTPFLFAHGYVFLTVLEAIPSSGHGGLA